MALYGILRHRSSGSNVNCLTTSATGLLPWPAER